MSVDPHSAPPITPWPAGEGTAMLVGGTFDPPHVAHVRLSDQARRLTLGDGAWIVYVPAARSPHKQDAPRASDADRVEMVRIATRGFERVAVWTDEIDRAREGGASYWIDTLRRAREAKAVGGGAGSPPLREERDERSLRFLIGADQAVAFHRWREFRDILELAAPIVVPRGDVRDAETLVTRLRAAGVWTHAEIDRWRSWLAPTEVIDACATSIRAALADPRRRDRPIEHLDEAVRAYIVREGLYL
ncbi:MAG: nicotinate-nicotinamide nucleotide adenylyltransferase [Phycisphaerales bacterium]